MQLTIHTPLAAPAVKFTAEDTPELAQSRYSEHKIIRRNGAVVGFEPVQDFDRDDQGLHRRQRRPGRGVARVRELVAKLTEAAVGALLRRQPSGGTFHIEDIQDQVELALMRSGEHEVARAYVLYREQARAGTRQAARSAGCSDAAAQPRSMSPRKASRARSTWRG